MHLDMDAFFAAVEQADNPEYRGKPVIVGGAERGVVSTASYEARRYGIHSAMPMFRARSLCPQGIFLPVRMSRYKEASRRVMEILSGVSPLVEQLSIDEACADISGTENVHGEPGALARSVKSAVREATGLTCSIGIAPNKFLAKIASDLQKPDGLTIIEEKDVRSFLEALPVEKIHGVGGKTARQLRSLGIVFASDILKLPLRFWCKKFGKWGARLHEKARGIDNAPVEPYCERKSMSAEETLARDTESIPELEKLLLSQAEEVGRDLRKAGHRARTVTLKIKYSDFRTITRSRSLADPFNSTQVLFDTARQLLGDLKLAGKVRLIGVGVSNFSSGFRQMQILPGRDVQKQEHLDEAIDRIRTRFGENAVRRGRVLLNAERPRSPAPPGDEGSR